MISVQEAEKIILETSRHFGTEDLPFETATGRVLAEPLFADRDLPPYNRVMMDGIAINFDSFLSGNRHFTIKGIQAAGEKPIDISEPAECIEIMTGAVLPATTDTIIRYEDLLMENGMALIQADNIKKGQNIHSRGMDKKKSDQVASSSQLITPAIISIAASIGKSTLTVSKLPSVIIISSGDELVDVDDQPKPYQVRRSNNYAVKSILFHYGIVASLLHIPDDREATTSSLGDALNNFDLIIISGGVSMGKFDLVPSALIQLGVEQLIYKVKQKPGKPFWFGKHEKGPLVFAFPGNPVATFLCLHRYLIPWLERSIGLQTPVLYAVLEEDIKFEPSLQYFLTARVSSSTTGLLNASDAGNNNSGDFASLADANAFIELPADKNIFRKGEVYRAWPFIGAGLI
ncbi:MAG: molybdopterin molybdotransferase MoeA [Chitinophagaceae bacterium]